MFLIITLIVLVLCALEILRLHAVGGAIMRADAAGAGKPALYASRLERNLPL